MSWALFYLCVQRLELESYSFDKQRKKPTLTLVWSASPAHPQTVRQTVTLFTPVVCRLVAANEPMKWIVRTETFIIVGIVRVPTPPGKSWNFYWKISRTWKVLENDIGPGKSWKSTCRVL